MMFALELGGPLLVWAGNRRRRVGFIAIAALQLGIFATGNFAFFNLLTVVVALPLLDDRVWSRILPAGLVERLASREQPARTPGRIKTGFEIALLGLGTLTLLGTFWPRLGYSWPIRVIEQFRSVNGYGLFRVMTTTRPQIVVEGSADGTEWKPYRFKYQAVDLEERPRLVEPHQPRLDWQLWFAALGRFETETWFQAFLLRLLEGSKPVTGLLADNPFPAEPPRYVRALLYDYRFTSWSERAKTGAWWRRTLIGEYAPVLSLTAFRRP